MIFGAGSKIHLLVINVKIDWIFDGSSPQKLKTFFREKHVSRRLLASVRNNNGEVLVNGRPGRKIDKLNPQDRVELVLPPEQISDNIAASFVPIDIAYEDRDYLLVNKPAHVASIPSPIHPVDSLISRLWGYFIVRGYDKLGIKPHIATRLDRDTSGLVLIAKHRFAHALVDSQLQARTVRKKYLALISGHLDSQHIVVDEPIGRDMTSLYKRKVTSGGKASISEFFLVKRGKNKDLVKVVLHTGRTHQIRVHASYIGHPLIGDSMYGGPKVKGMDRQDLHCCFLEFDQQFLNRKIKTESHLPDELRAILQE